jgi:hypothetical protein
MPATRPRLILDVVVVVDGGTVDVVVDVLDVVVVVDGGTVVVTVAVTFKLP